MDSSVLQRGDTKMNDKYAKSETEKDWSFEKDSTTYEHSLKVYGNDADKVRILAESVK